MNENIKQDPPQAPSSEPVSYSRNNNSSPNFFDKFFSFFTKKTVAAFVVVILVIGVGAATIAVQNSTEIRQRADGGKENTDANLNNHDDDDSTPTVTPTQKAPPCLIPDPLRIQLQTTNIEYYQYYGDANGDGNVSKKDSDLILEHEASSNGRLPIRSQIEVADVSGLPNVISLKDEVNNVDSLLILQYVDGLISTFPVCSTAPSSPTPTTPPGLTPITISADFDGDVNISSTTCFDTNTTLRLEGYPPYRTYIRFPLGAIPAGSIITKAVFTYRVTKIGPSVSALQAYNQNGQADPFSDSCSARRTRTVDDTTPYFSNYNLAGSTGLKTLTLPTGALSDIQSANNISDRFSLALNESGAFSSTGYLEAIESTGADEAKLTITYSTPISSPSPTISPGTTASPTPTIPAGNTVFALTIGLDGLGTTGDNNTPNNSSGSNKNPMHPSRTITAEVFDGSNNPVANKSGTLIYQTGSGKFTGNLDMGTLASGNYNIKVKSDGYLRRLIPGIQNVIAGQIYNVPAVNLVTGNINRDNAIDILDYNILISCSVFSTDNRGACNANSQYSVLSDLEDNGVVNQFDYNLFLRELSVQNGD